MSPAVVFCLLSLAVLARVNCQPWSNDNCDRKYEECINLGSSGFSCAQLNETIFCLTTYLHHQCSSQALVAAATRNMTIKVHYCPQGCSSEPTIQDCILSFFTPTTPLPDSSPTPSPPGCSYSPSLPLPPSPLFSDLGSPSLAYHPPSPECTLPVFETVYRQHCSVFSLSHLRPFSDRDHPLQTCLLPGHFYLLKHRSLSVSISGAYKIGTVGYYTEITEVNVTLHGHSCFPHTVLYRATGEELPQPTPSQLFPGLQLSVNKTVASIVAPWINTTIIIHQADKHLSVSLQVPEPLSRANEVTGLCSEGCPPSFQPLPKEMELKWYGCTDNRYEVSVMCLVLGLAIPPSGTTTYSDLCLYDILKTHDLSLLSLYSALNQDALLLPDVTEIYTNPPTTVMSETTPTSQHPQQVVSSIVILPPSEEPLVSQTVPSTHPLLSLTLLSLFLSLCLR